MLKTIPSKYLITFVFLAFIILALNTFLVRRYGKYMSYISGDEPHYVMMTESLVMDGDFNLKNDYYLGRAAKYYPIPGLFPHLPPKLDHKASGKWYSIHTIGLPLLLALPYKFDGVVGARLFVLFLQLSTVVLFYFVLTKYVIDKTKVLFGLILLLSCSLFWQNLGGLFPDMFTVWFFLASILLFSKKEWYYNLVFSVLVVASLLVHTKIILLIAPIYLFHNVWLIKKNGLRFWSKNILIFIVGIGLAIVLYSEFLYRNYGIISPTQMYGEKGQLFSGNYITNGLAILTDRVKGLIIYFPIMTISVPYIYFFVKYLHKIYLGFHKTRHITKRVCLLSGISLGSVALLITQLGFDDWSGSNSPNGRYMMVFIFMLIIAIAKYANFNDRFQKCILGGFVLLNFIVTAFFMVRPNTYMDPGINSIIINKIRLLRTFPMYGIISSANIHNSMVLRSGFILLVILVANLVLIKIYKAHDGKN